MLSRPFALQPLCMCRRMSTRRRQLMPRRQLCRPHRLLLYGCPASWLWDLGCAVGAEGVNVHAHSHPLPRDASYSWTLHPSPSSSPLDVQWLGWAQQLMRPHTALTSALGLKLCSSYICMPSLPPEELGVSAVPCSFPLQALSPPACSASKGCTRVKRSPMTSVFLPCVFTLDVFLPLSSTS